MLFLVCCGALFATSYYVAPWGNDSYSGMSWDSAFVTLQHAANIVDAGDSVFAANGEYVGFDLRTGGTTSLPIVFEAVGDSVVINVQNPVTTDGINIEGADWVVIDGFNLIDLPRAGIRVALSQHVEVKNNFCDHNGRWGVFTGFADYAYIHHNICQYSQAEHGIYFSNSGDHPTIRYNICHHNNANGIHMNGDESMGGDGLITDATVECNIIYENGANGGSGINCDGVAESYIFNNLLFMNHASGISLYRIDASAGSYNTRVYNNTIINAADARWCVNINAGSTDDTLYNNILINQHSWRGSIAIDQSSLSGFHSDYNVVVDRLSNDGGNTTMTLTEWQALGYDLHSMLADPLDSIFVNWLAGDYHLRDNSQAIDAGTDVSAIVQYDLDSIARPQGNGFDIGSYEYYAGEVQEDEPHHTACGHVFQHGNTICFTSLHVGDIISVYDITGRNHFCAAAQSVFYEWTPLNIPSGIYFYDIESDHVNQCGKLIFLK
ncbi:right-handed parallel beta-helix repeat-containing protein [candidate division WOR-3 bacterium]|nr:right-handed parallel beta-helix repeat-containing protein [candidate division WOR-3 bacterium]